jgi:hypothetical protein
MVYPPADTKLAVVVGGAADFSDAFHPPPLASLSPPWYTCLPPLAVVVSGAADFSGAFDTHFSAKLFPPWYHHLLVEAASCATDLSGAFRLHSFLPAMVLPFVKMVLTVLFTHSTKAALGMKSSRHHTGVKIHSSWNAKSVSVGPFAIPTLKMGDCGGLWVLITTPATAQTLLNTKVGAPALVALQVAI